MPVAGQDLRKTKNDGDSEQMSWATDSCRGQNESELGSTARRTLEKALRTNRKQKYFQIFHHTVIWHIAETVPSQIQHSQNHESQAKYALIIQAIITGAITQKNSISYCRLIPRNVTI